MSVLHRRNALHTAQQPGRRGQFLLAVETDRIPAVEPELAVPLLVACFVGKYPGEPLGPDALQHKVHVGHARTGRRSPAAARRCLRRLNTLGQLVGHFDGQAPRNSPLRHTENLRAGLRKHLIGGGLRSVIRTGGKTEQRRYPYQSFHIL